MINLSRYFGSNMTIILSCGIISLFLFGCQANDLFLQKPAAARFLSRFRRANYMLEEMKQGKLERECFEETCSKEEVREVFENDLKTANFWMIYVLRDSLFQTAKKILEEQKKINEIMKKLGEVKQNISDYEDQFFAKLEACADGK
ncbi:coagulation factor X-like [Cetorhinus maximus]